MAAMETVQKVASRAFRELAVGSQPTKHAADALGKLHTGDARVRLDQSLDPAALHRTQ